MPQLTIEYVQKFLRDAPENNELLDDVEFPPETIRICMDLAVNYWNEVPPILPPVYNLENFPYMVTHLYGTCHFLYLGKALEEERNQLAYQTGGVSIDDHHRYEAYMQAASFYESRFKEEMTKQKIVQNDANAYTYIDSDYRDLGNFW